MQGPHTLPVIQVGIADDHPIVRRALHGYLDAQEGLRVAGVACSGREAIDLVRRCAIDVLLLDLDMPRQSGLDALTAIKACSRVEGLAVLILSAYPEDPYAVPLMRSGASGYLNKACVPAQITAAIRCVAQGRRFITPVVADLLAGDALATAGVDAPPRLSTRELQMLVKFARGRTPGQVACELSLSPKTASFYRTRLMRKLHARSDSELTCYAFRQRLVG